MRVFVVAALGVLAGCTRVICPPEMPEAVAPEVVGDVPVPEGQGRVVVDVVDGPTEVFRFAEQSVVIGMDKDRPIVVTSQARETVCVSPCAIDLDPGRYTFGFPTPGGGGRLELDHVDVGLGTSVYRRDLGSYEGAGAGLPLGIVGATLGGMAMVTGIVLLPVGLATDGDGMALAGGITLGVGTVLTALGIVGIALSPNTVQPGRGIQFDLEP